MGRALVTRADERLARSRSLKGVPAAVYNPVSRLIRYGHRAGDTRGTVAVLSGGTSDIPVAEEAAETAEWLGCQVDRIYDVGVAGIDRLLAQRERIRKAKS